jgi:hypothetical protein
MSPIIGGSRDEDHLRLLLLVPGEVSGNSGQLKALATLWLIGWTCTGFRVQHLQTVAGPQPWG